MAFLRDKRILEGHLEDAQRMIRMFDCLSESKTKLAENPDLINTESDLTVFYSNPDSTGSGSDIQAAVSRSDSREMPLIFVPRNSSLKVRSLS